jgi:transcriptional regulator with XRE-family HTH domain
MDSINTRQLAKETEFYRKLLANELTTPNDFTKGLGKLVKKAREEKGYSQAKLADAMSRRQATVSDIENGKSEIGLLTLILLCVILNKPITYFIPPTIYSGIVSEINNPLEQEALNLIKLLEYGGDPSLAVELIKTLVNHSQKYKSEE